MNHGRLVMLGVGVGLIGAGAVVFTRHTPDEGAVYLRRIAGTMLTVFGVVLMLFAVGLTLAGVDG